MSAPAWISTKIQKLQADTHETGAPYSHVRAAVLAILAEHWDTFDAIQEGEALRLVNHILDTAYDRQYRDDVFKASVAAGKRRKARFGTSAGKQADANAELVAALAAKLLAAK